MGRFGRLKQLDISEKTIDFPLPEAHVPQYCERPPVLELAHMGRSNKRYFSARMSMAAKSIAESVSTAKDRNEAEKQATAAATAEATSLDRDRELIPTTIIRGWRDLYDDTGVEVEYSEESAVELVSELPDDIIDRMRHEASGLSRFRSTPMPTPEQLEAATKN